VKILPFLFFLIFLICFIFFASDFNMINTKAYAQNVTVTATVDEHLSFSVNHGSLVLSTNFQNGLMLIDKQETVCFNKPVQVEIASGNGPFILIVNY